MTAGSSDLRDELIEAMGEKEIETQIGTYAIHHTDAFRDARQHGYLDNSTDLYHNLLTLPVSHSMTKSDQQRVVKTLQSEIKSRI